MYFYLFCIYVVFVLDAFVKAKQDCARMQEELMERLSNLSKMPTSQLRFIVDAWNQIIECRRMLKWTYAYGYYQFLDDAKVPELVPQRNFFEFLQV